MLSLYQMPKFFVQLCQSIHQFFPNFIALDTNHLLGETAASADVVLRNVEVRGHQARGAEKTVVEDTLPLAEVSAVVEIEGAVEAGERSGRLHAKVGSLAHGVAGGEVDGLRREQPGLEVGRVVASHGVTGALVVVGEALEAEQGVHGDGRAG